MRDLERFYPVNYPKATHLKAQLYYSLGGYNCFTCKTESRGYYMSIVPVERQERYGVMTESFAAFTGLKMCVVPVQRKSKKKLEEALKYFNEHVDEFIQAHFSEYGADLANYTERGGV